MTEDQEKELLEFARQRIAGHKARLGLKFGGNIDNFSSKNSQVVFLDKPKGVEQAPPPNLWRVTIDGPNVITTETRIVYSSGFVFEDTDSDVPIPWILGYQEGNEEILGPRTSIVYHQAIGFPGSYEGTVKQTIRYEFSVQNFQFAVRLGIRRVVDTFVQGEPSEPVSDDIDYVDFTSDEPVEYMVEPNLDTYVILSAVSITRL